MRQQYFALQYPSLIRLTCWRAEVTRNSNLSCGNSAAMGQSTFRQRRMRLAPLAVAFAAVSLIGLGIIVPSRARATGPAAKPTKAVETLPAPVKTYGLKNAPIELEVFGDYECPSCG